VAHPPQLVIPLWIPIQRGVTRPVLGSAPQETFLASTHSTPPATSWHSGILAQLATSLGQRIWEGRPGLGVGRAQTRNIGRTGSDGGSVVGLMAWFPYRDFIQVLCGCSACAGRAAVALAGARLSRASPELGLTNLLRCPSTAPGVVAGATLSVLQVEAGGERAWLAGRRRVGPHAQQGKRHGGQSALPECQPGSRELQERHA